MRKMIGVGFIIIGAVLAAWGYDIYASAGSQISRALSADAPIEAWIGMVGGAIFVLVGITKVK